MKQSKIILMLGLVVAVAGCASSKSGDTYTRDEARRVQNVQMGVVEGSRPIKIEGTKSGIGTGAGAIVGGIAGSSTGQGKGSSIGAVLGAVAGGVVGAAAEEGFTREEGMEITVRLENGRLISVVQGGKEQFQPGDRVRVLGSGGETRVTH
ncbi:MAG: glycine zipper 2TM domain-containing protein [Nitrosomonadales bacterium]|nr:glycine zipper 2TM domain-containing protein [candidate division KSB1 bacterium]MBI5660094.1 glycine zipper 2TM domain-containing protein [Nitrosomonadales bacterium]